METKDSIKTDKYGRVILSSDQLIKILLQGKKINRLTVKKDEDIDLFKNFQLEIINDNINFIDEIDESLDIDEFHERQSESWTFPEIYQQLDVHKWLISKCKTEEEIQRVEYEYNLYKEKNLVMLLRLFIFLVDYMRENKYVWGVGRGSSVSSYILYLIGVHKVNSLLYNLDVKEYLK